MKIVENNTENRTANKAEGYSSQVLAGINANKMICYKMECIGGTEKQNNWAEEIKLNWLTNIVSALSSVIDKGRTTRDNATEIIGKVANWLESLTDSRKVIDMHSKDAMEILKMVMIG